MNQIHAYLRGSTDAIHLENQQNEIETAFPHATIQFHLETASGKLPASQRPVLRGLLSSLKEGDTLIVTEISRLGRDAVDVIHTVTGLRLDGITLHIIRSKESKDVFIAMITTLLDAFSAQKERENNSERTKAGLQRARSQGKTLGKPKGTSKLKGNPQAERTVETMLKKRFSKAAIARELNCSVGTLERYLDGLKAT
jgi:putative DNA-invertase from lambdoid prophage Rac